MTSVFISYSRKDKDVADYLAEQLRSRGSDVFIDYERLNAGEDFSERLAKEIERRDVLLLLVSAQSTESKWVRAEVNWAYHHNKKIIPIMLENVNLSAFFFLVSVEQVDFRRWKADKQVTDGLAKLTRSLGLREVNSGAASAKAQGSVTIEEKPRHTDNLMSTQVGQRVKNIVSELLGVDAGLVVSGARLREDLEADDLDMVEILMAVEEEFEIEILDEHAIELDTVGSFVKYVKDYTGL